MRELCEYARSLGCKAAENEPMSKHISFKLGGAAKAFIEPNSEENLIKIIKKCVSLGVPYAVIGNGSNLLVRDEGIDGAVIHRGADFGKIELIDDTTIFCEAGASLMKVCNFALEHSLTGLEFAYGIPGSVGGAVYMNAGAYDGEMSQILLSVTVLDESGEIRTFPAEALELRYRHSIFMEKDWIVLTASVMPEQGIQDEIRAKMQDLLGRRKAKQPL